VSDVDPRTGEPRTGEPRTGEPRTGDQDGQDARGAATQLVHALYRLIKVCMLHFDENQAVASAVDFTRKALISFCQVAGADTATLVFAMDSVFVNGQIFRGSRESYALATELGAFLETCGVSEVAIEKPVTENELATFGRLIAEGQRDKAAAARVRAVPLPNLRARRVRGAGAEGALAEDNSPAARIVRTYSGSVVIMRGLYDDLKAGELKFPSRVKRVAQRLVAHADTDVRHLIALAASAPSEPDPASVAVTTAVLAVAMARQVTSDRLVLGAIATSALLFDAGRPRLLHPKGADVEVRGLVERSLGEDELDRLAPSTVVVLTALGRIHPPSVTRAVIAYEALGLRRPARGPLYGGRRPPTVHARIVQTARLFTELRMTAPGDPPVSIDDAIQLMMARATDANSRTYVKLLVGTLGIYPAGTLVELSTGELAVVMATPALPVDFSRPPVRIMKDAS
jgi:hypothetical protein